MDIKQLGEEIRVRREALQMSQGQLGEKSKLSLKTIYRIENGLKDPKVSSVYLIAKALDTSIPELFQKIS